MRKFSIIVDSSCDLHAEYFEKNGIEVLPMPFTLGEKEYSGGWQKISPHEFYGALKNGDVAKTAQINAGAYAEVFSKYAIEHKNLIYLALSSGLSSSYGNSVSAAKGIMRQYPGFEVYPVDSLNAAAGIGLLAMLLVNNGEELTAAEAVKYIEEKKNSVFALFTVDDLNFLHRGGRLSMLSAVSGSVMHVKPLLNISPEGVLTQKEKVRGRKEAMDTLVDQMKRSLAPNTHLGTVTISHCDCEEDAQRLADSIKNRFEKKHVTVVMMSPIIGAHAGPGAIALFFEAGMPRVEYEAKFYQ